MKFLLGDGDREIDIATPVVVRSHQSSCSGCEDIYAYWVEDADGKAIQDGCNGLHEGDEQEIMMFALNELASLRSDRDALKARVEELENTIDCGCNALTDSICCSGNDADTNLGFVRKMKRVLIGNNPTTPGGDDGK